MNSENKMRTLKIEKVVLSCGATGERLEKSKKLLEFLTGKKAHKIASRKRIPDFGVRPGLEVGTRVTLRGKAALEMLRRILTAVDNTLKKKQVAENHLSFGIKEYIEVPGVEYQRDIGILGLNITVDLKRAGARVARRKIKSGKLPKRQHVSKEDVIKFMEENFKTSFA
jgi:large subunit ribosomal protein L5